MTVPSHNSVLTQAERNYSVIQRECLAVVYGMKQFRHYLLGRSFTVLTDHAPLQWLSAQKMEGLLARWALAIQEYDFTIRYRKGGARAPTQSLTVMAGIDTCNWEETKYGKALRNDQVEGDVMKKIWNIFYPSLYLWHEKHAILTRLEVLNNISMTVPVLLLESPGKW